MLEVRTLRWADNPDGPNLITYILKIKGPFPIIVRNMTTEKEAEKDVT